MGSIMRAPNTSSEVRVNVGCMSGTGLRLGSCPRWSKRSFTAGKARCMAQTMFGDASERAGRLIDRVFHNAVSDIGIWMTYGSVPACLDNATSFKACNRTCTGCWRIRSKLCKRWADSYNCVEESVGLCKRTTMGLEQAPQWSRLCYHEA
jgi:hypothetical protein